MKKRLLLIFLLLASGFKLQATYVSLLELDTEFFNLCLFIFNKNIVRVERYSLSELQSDVNYISRKISNAHCSHIMHLGEPGMHVESLKWNEANPHEFQVIAYRGKNAVEYTLNWPSLIMCSDQIQDFMMADAQITDLNLRALECEVPAEGIAACDQTKSVWQTGLQISWGLVDKKSMNLVFDRPMQSVCAVVIPNCLCKDLAANVQLLKKSDLLESGLLAKFMHEDEQGALKASVLVEDPLQEPCAVEADYAQCKKRIEQADDYTEKEPVKVVEQQHSWPASWYYALVAKLVTLKNFVAESLS